MNYQKVGGLHFWRVGRFGGSFYVRRTARCAYCLPELTAYAVTVLLAFASSVN